MSSLFDYNNDKVKIPGAFLECGDVTVVFIDIVGVTKNDNEKMRNAVRSLQNHLVDVLIKVKWDTEGSENGAILIPTGDGYAIGFEKSIVDDKEILEYAKEISIRMGQEGFPVRIGINNGPCFYHLDLNKKLNLCGWGIVDAERTMSLGDKSHILCEASFAKSVGDSKKNPDLHKIKIFKVKHGRELTIYNYYSDGWFGNSEKPEQPTFKKK